MRVSGCSRTAWVHDKPLVKRYERVRCAWWNDTWTAVNQRSRFLGSDRYGVRSPQPTGLHERLLSLSIRPRLYSLTIRKPQISELSKTPFAKKGIADARVWRDDYMTCQGKLLRLSCRALAAPPRGRFRSGNDAATCGAELSVGFPRS